MRYIGGDELELPERKANRLKDYDYSSNGAYFITICTKDRNKLLWNVGADIIRPPETQHLSEYGKCVEIAINSVSNHYHNVDVEKYVIMPNHIHMILMLSTEDGRIISAPTKEIAIIVGQMKRWASKQMGFPLWQKSFHDHVIRDEQDYRKIWKYIDTNSLKWEEDCFYRL